MDTVDIARCERPMASGTDRNWARLAAATLFSWFAFPVLAPAQVSFGPPSNFVVGSNPQWVAVGDFNQDGILDLAVACRGTNAVSVLLGNGNGTFQPATSFLANLAPTSVAVGDFNGDGLQDLVTTNYNSNDVSVLLGNGNGTFGPPLNLPVGAGSTPNYVAVGDFNLDGHDDLAVATYGSASYTSVAVLLGNGNGTFQAPQSVTTGRGPLWVAVGDLNGDGMPDLAVANFNADVATVSVLLGNGNGTFQAARNTPVNGAACVTVGDFNANGLEDLAVVDYYSGNVAVLLGNGDGTSSPAVIYTANFNALTVTVGDLNGDGVQDLAVANWNQNTGNTVSLLVGNGDGTFQAKQDIVLGQGVAGAVQGDFDGDGAPDLVVPSFAVNYISVLLNTTTHAPNTLTVNKPGSGSGTVTSSPAGINCGATCSAPYDGGTVVTLTASPGGGSNFTGWSGGGCSGTGSCVVTMSGSTTVTATFNVQTFTLTVNKPGSGSGTVTSSPAGISCGATCSAPYNSGTVVTLTAAAAGGSTFAGWSGGGCSDAGSCVVTMNAATTVTATFDPPSTFTLTVNKPGSGSGTVTSSPAGISCGATCSAPYNSGTVVTLTAAAAGGSTFAGWSGGGCSGTGSCMVTMNASTTVTATFDLPQTFTLTVNKSGTGSGTVTSNPAGISCGATCSAPYNSGTVVTLTASPAGGSTFAGWSGGGCSGAGTCAVTMSAATTVTATFNVQTFTLSVSKSGSGSGTVTSNPAGISCGATCSAPYNSGTVVTLTASPAGGSTFAGWSGGGCSGTGTCAVTMGAATTVTATFNAQTFTLSVSKSGSGSGTVTSIPAGISCGATCSAPYNSGTVVTLTAGPAGGSSFSGWSGGGCSGTGTCTVTLTANVTVSASFAGSTPVSAPVLKWQYGGCLAGPYCDTGWYSSPAVADLDGDGQPDVIWGSYDVVALNGANGGLKWRGTNSGRVWPDIVVADLTGDGTPEVIVGRSSDQLTAYNRLGGVMWTKNPFGGGEVRSLAVEDLETDGQLEIVAGSASTSTTYQVNVYEPNGTVRSGWPARHAGDPGYGAGLFNENLAVADMNGDGFKEVFAPTASHYITALNRSGAQLGVNGVYAPRTVWSQVGVGVDNAVDLRGYANCGTEHRPNFENSAPVVADVNGDGVPEVIVVGDINNCATNTSLYQMPFIFKLDRTRWSGSGFDWTAIPTPGPGSAPRSVDYAVIETAVPNPVVVDLDGDGFKEILYPSYDGKVHAYWLDKTEHGSWPYTVPATGVSGDDFRFASEPVVVDINNDGPPEVIFTSWPKKATGGVGQLHILDYLGQELYRINLPGPAIGDTWNGGLGAPTVANVDSDPDLEVVVGTVSSGVVAYELPNSANARVLWGTGRGSYRRTGTPPPSP